MCLERVKIKGKSNRLDVGGEEFRGCHAVHGSGSAVVPERLAWRCRWGAKTKKKYPSQLRARSKLSSRGACNAHSELLNNLISSPQNLHSFFVEQNTNFQFHSTLKLQFYLEFPAGVRGLKFERR